MKSISLLYLLLIENCSDKLVVLNITKESHGNALGIGLADVTTRELVDKINYKDMYTNAITSTFLNRAKIPMMANTEKEAVEMAIKTCWQPNQKDLKLLIIKNTLDLEYLYISEAIWNEIKDRKKFEICGNWEHLSFNIDGKMKIRL